ncbi:uncharacterized protein PpBr36_11311 [Pyricularia pennisetigena]|uniref:uncharacterized protein n=1 Tax=Pyricularia pennisetigena TaxID=1578925 RepID=UPI0011546BAF|nr:uncharacterized protein PpBr36_11311 [Pyricularia pennisetigena]TLS20594.1 hypothetical protein PpBr36_11311 [Pyricularia pennisetigena]
MADAVCQTSWHAPGHSIPSPVSPPTQNPTHQSLVQLQHHAHPPQSSPSAPSDHGRAYTQPYPTKNISGHSIPQSHVPFQPPHPPPSDSRREPSFGNGQSVLRPPPPPSEHGHGYIQSPHEPSPPTHNTYPAPCQGCQDYSPYGAPASVAASKQRPKHQRVSQACDRCRLLKAKCDEQKPCKNCKEKNEQCNYKEPIVKHQDKVQTEVLEVVQAINSKLDSKFKALDDRFDVLEDAIGAIAAALGIGALPAIPKAIKVEQSGSKDAVSNVQASPNSGRGELADESRLEVAPPAITCKYIVKEAEEPIPLLDDDGPIPPGSPIPVGKPAIPENHTTGAGNLLKWSAIHNLVGSLLKDHGIKHPEAYPLKIEESRSFLHLYGRGEGNKRDGLKEVPNDFGLFTSNPNDVAPSPSSNNDWGHMDIMELAPYSPQNSALTSDTKATPRRTPGGLRLDAEHVRKLATSYKDNMQNMHPIILPRDLDDLITQFIRSVHSVKATAVDPPVAGFASPEAGKKRKREDADSSSEASKTQFQGRSALPSDIKTAVVLCILALGEICLHKDRIPDVVPINGEKQNPVSVQYGSRSSPVSRNGMPPSSVEGTPPSACFTSTGGKRASFQGSTGPVRNAEIPGLQYLASATDILHNQLGDTSIWHVYANILAGLYYGQLGRVMESYWHIHHACVKAQHLLRNAPQDIKDIHYYLIYWTCMQLECDIIAELNLQQSGISKYEGSMRPPNLPHMIECGINERVAYSYHGQIWLRKTLNQAHTELYGPKSEREKFSLKPLVETLLQNLTPGEDRWWPKHHPLEPETPADNILDARLRAKYWGAINIICRPVIKSILEREYIQTNQVDASLDRTDPLNEELDPDDSFVRDIAKRGINALLHSTKAFHGLKETRYIVTNIFGTAQAQWGNLITLAAVYKNKHLSQLFFDVVACQSSALEIGREILVGLKKSLFPDEGTQ